MLGVALHKELHFPALPPMLGHGGVRSLHFVAIIHLRVNYINICIQMYPNPASYLHGSQTQTHLYSVWDTALVTEIKINTSREQERKGSARVSQQM